LAGRYEQTQIIATAIGTPIPNAPPRIIAKGEITIGWNNDGDMILSDWPNEDAVIVIARDYLWTFVDRLTDQMGIPKTKDLTR